MRIGLGISLLAITIFSLLVVGNIFSNNNKNQVSQTFYSGPSVKIRNTEIPVEVARSAEETEKGLSGRPSLEKDMGMLFIFHEPGLYTFWMPDMHFPIDIIWINEGRVVGVTPNVPNEAPPDKPLPIYAPPAQARYVLEVNAGFAAKHGIVAGDEVTLKGI